MRHILVVAMNIRGPIEKKWVGVLMHVNYDFGVSSVEAVHSPTG